jgi:hypothetical protein
MIARGNLNRALCSLSEWLKRFFRGNSPRAAGAIFHGTRSDIGKELWRGTKSSSRVIYTPSAWWKAKLSWRSSTMSSQRSRQFTAWSDQLKGFSPLSTFYDDCKTRKTRKMNTREKGGKKFCWYMRSGENETKFIKWKRSSQKLLFFYGDRAEMWMWSLQSSGKKKISRGECKRSWIFPIKGSFDDLFVCLRFSLHIPHTMTPLLAPSNPFRLPSRWGKKLKSWLQLRVVESILHQKPFWRIQPVDSLTKRLLNQGLTGFPAPVISDGNFLIACWNARTRAFSFAPPPPPAQSVQFHFTL